jgi:hypothetical protein
MIAEPPETRCVPSDLALPEADAGGVGAGLAFARPLLLPLAPPTPELVNGRLLLDGPGTIVWLGKLAVDVWLMAVAEGTAKELMH